MPQGIEEHSHTQQTHAQSEVESGETNAITNTLQLSLNPDCTQQTHPESF